MARNERRGVDAPAARLEPAAGSHRIWPAAVFLFAFCLRPAGLAAQSGGQAGAFLDFGVGARALGMGGAFFGISDDATAVFWNPAGLAQLQQKEITAMDASLYAQTSMLYLGYGQPTKSKGTFGLGVAQLQSSGFESVNAAFDTSGNVTQVTSNGTFTSQQQAIDLAWGKAITDKTDFGATLDYLTRKLGSSSDHFATVGLGMLRRMGFYQLGLDFQNVFEEGAGDTLDKLPPTLNIGNAVRLFQNRLLIDLDANAPLSGGYDLRFGGEYWVSHWFAARFGLMGLPGIQETDFGFGFRFSGLMLDLAEGLHVLGNSTRLSLTYRFGQSTRSMSKALIEDYIKQALRALNQGDFAMAAGKLKLALDADPTNAKIKAMLSRLMAVTDYIPQAVGSQEYRVFERKGAFTYVNGIDIHGAVNDLRYAYNKNSRDDKLLGLLNMVEKEAGAEITRRVEGVGQFTWVDQKIFDARQAVYQGRYNLAVRRAQDILEIEPNNITALQVMGSAFYMMDQKGKATAVWKKVLELDPSNREVRQFLSNIQKQ